MPEIDREMMERYSTDTGFHVDVIEKVYRLTELLREINDISNVRNKLVLKGGTAINFIYFDIPRLSVDIDVDYIGSAKRSEMLRDRKYLEDIFLRVFKKLGYQVVERKPYALLQYMLSYVNTAGNKDRIKLEVNFFNRVTAFKEIEMDFKNFFGFKELKVSTLLIEELFGRKMRALVTRGTPRDLYDVYYLLNSKIKISMEKLRKCFIFYLCCHGDPRKMSLEFVESITQKDIKTGLLPLLRKGEKIDAAELKETVMPLLKEFFILENDEEKFVVELYDRKKYLPEILFGGLDYNRQIKYHPGIEWKIKNL